MKITTQRKTSKYRPNLPSLMSLCASNYVLSLKLLADNEHEGEQRNFFISGKLAYVLMVKEVTKYTSVIEITQQNVIPNNIIGEVIRPKMLVRLYHDARVAEVISSQGVRHVKPRYDYPNDCMHQPDEKLQINQFLKEWLQISIEHGHTSCSFQR